MTHLLTYATAFLGRHFRVTQRESLEIQAYPVELKRRETTKSCRVFYLMELKPQEERQFLIFEYDDVTWKPRIADVLCLGSRPPLLQYK